MPDDTAERLTLQLMYSVCKSLPPDVAELSDDQWQQIGDETYTIAVWLAENIWRCDHWRCWAVCQERAQNEVADLLLNRESCAHILTARAPFYAEGGEAAVSN